MKWHSTGERSTSNSNGDVGERKKRDPDWNFSPRWNSIFASLFMKRDPTSSRVKNTRFEEFSESVHQLLLERIEGRKKSDCFMFESERYERSFEIYQNRSYCQRNLTGKQTFDFDMGSVVSIVLLVVCSGVSGKSSCRHLHWKMMPWHSMVLSFHTRHLQEQEDVC